jgi:hypothetical protein
MFTLIPRLIFTVIIKGFFEGFIKRIIESIFKRFFKGMNQASPNDFTPQLHDHFHLWVINIILNGILKGIILASLRVIDGGFCPGNELLTLRRGLRHSRYVFLSNRLLELGIGYWASGIGFRLQFPVASNAAFTPYPVPVGLSKTSTARKSTSS